jgi:hypothetical protein
VLVDLNVYTGSLKEAAEGSRFFTYASDDAVW